MNPVVIAVGAMVVIGGLAVAFTIRSAAKRRQALEALAREHGVLYMAEAGHVLPSLSHLRLFDRGHGRKASDLISDSAGTEFWLFEYRYVTGSGKNRHTHRMTVAAFPKLSAELPAFELCREHIFHKIGQAFGFQDIDFPEHPSFSKRYLLRGLDERAVRALFDEGLMESFNKVSKINVEAAGTCMVVYRPGVRVKPRDLLAFLDEAAGVRDAIVARAALVRDDVGVKPPAFI
jgi:hypothetical protein